MNLSEIAHGDERKHLFKLKYNSNDKLALQINHNIRKGSKTQTIRLVNLIFDKSSDTLAVININGDVFFIDFTNNKYWTIPIVISCTILKFSPLKRNEILFGSSNGNITILNNQDGRIVDVLTGHKQPIVDLSFSNNNLCLSSSNHEAILWSLEHNCKLHVLNLRKDVVLNFTHFIPLSNHILACFQDNSIHIWKYGTFELLKQIPPSNGRFKVKTIAITRNGRALVIGGNSSELIIFLTDVLEMVKTINLPTIVTSVKKLEFISKPFDGGSNRLLAILTGNGRLYFYDMEADCILDQIHNEQEIVKITTSFTGKYVACNLTSGIINVYNIGDHSAKCSITLSKELQQKSTSILKPNVSNIKFIKSQMTEILDLDKLKSILKIYGEYPENYRITIWTYLLKLPKNKQAYKSINNSVYKSSFIDLEKEYPLQDKLALKNLKKLLNNLVSWCPFFAHVTYLPLFVFPFVKIFKNEPLLLFEAICTIITNWCQYWFQYHPMLPINVLAMIENMLIEHEPELIAHFARNDVTSKLYAWPLLESIFSEAITSNDWCILFDHILSNEPSFLLIVVVSYNMINKKILLSLNNLEDFEHFYHFPNPIDLKRLITKCYDLIKITKNHPRYYLKEFRAIESDCYPLFEQYPTTLFDIEDNAIKLNEDDAIKDEEKRISSIKMLKEMEQRNVLIKEAEEARLNELEKVYHEKIHEQRMKVLKKREELAKLRKLFQQEEIGMLSASRHMLNIKLCRDKQRAVRNVMDALEENRYLTNVDVLKAEGDMILHYSNILKSRQDIETLLRTDDHMINVDSSDTLLANDKEKLNEEIRKVQSCISSKQYLKHLNVTTGLCAINNLIERVEGELSRVKSKNNNDYKTHGDNNTSKLAIETKELEKEVSSLLKILKLSKSSNDFEEFNEKFIRKIDY